MTLTNKYLAFTNVALLQSAGPLVGRLLFLLGLVSFSDPGGQAVLGRGSRAENAQEGP